MNFLRRLRKRSFFVLGCGALGLALALWVGYAVAATRWPWVLDREKVREANRIILAVESFQSRTGRLPETLADAGVGNPESLEVFYRKESDSTYIVWFGTVLGESATYESSTHKWH